MREVLVGARADGEPAGVGVQVGAHDPHGRLVLGLLRGQVAPEVRRQDGAVVQEVGPLVVPRVRELHEDGQVVDLLDRLDEGPDVAVRDDRVLAQLDGVDDVIGREGLAVGPGDALAELDGVLVVGGPLPALGEPGDVLVGHGVVVEERLVDEAERAHGVGPVGDGVPARDRAPLLAARVERLLARELLGGLRHRRHHRHDGERRGRP